MRDAGPNAVGPAGIPLNLDEIKEIVLVLTERQGGFAVVKTREPMSLDEYERRAERAQTSRWDI